MEMKDKKKLIQRFNALDDETRKNIINVCPWLVVEGNLDKIPGEKLKIFESLVIDAENELCFADAHDLLPVEKMPESKPNANPDKNVQGILNDPWDGAEKSKPENVLPKTAIDEDEPKQPPVKDLGGG